ncbi:MAG: NAD-dependent succinate-semialdehyde dehydrogenase [Verrucomicrobiota bacterium]
MATTIKVSDYAVLNPTTGEVLLNFNFHSDVEVGGLLRTANNAYENWKRLSLSERSALFRRVAEILQSRQEELAQVMAIEMGKPVAQGKAEIVKCSFVCNYFADHAESFLAPYDVKTELAETTVIYRPLGTVFAIMPWNFPLWQVFRAAAPTLMAGNTMLLKHAPRVPQTALEIEKIMLEAGFPAGVLINVFASNEQAAKIIADPSIKGVCLTGSGRAGRSVAAEAGRHLKPALLELGGSDPYIVLEDADLKLAAEKIAFSRMLNNGQTCISAKRFIVHEAVADEFTNNLIEVLKKQVIGDPLVEGVTQGPMAREDLVNELQIQVIRSVHAGAKIIYQGSTIEGSGFFFPVTLLSNVKPETPAFKEELFGPVGAIITAKSTEEAVSLANQSAYGLGSAIFTGDIELGRHLAANELNAGTCVVNDFVRSDPRLPFGGINESGYGRELGAEGIKEFVNIKTIAVG